MARDKNFLVGGVPTLPLPLKDRKVIEVAAGWATERSLWRNSSISEDPRPSLAGWWEMIGEEMLLTESRRMKLTTTY